MCRLVVTLLAASTTCHGLGAPDIAGMSRVWSDGFAGKAGSCVDTDNWGIAGSALSVNLELQTYTDDPTNLQLSGLGTVQLVPVMGSDGSWTSSRIESKGSWMAEPGAKLRIQASLRTGASPGSGKKGIWPAFWTLGDAVRHGTDWPLCGELDIMERVNGAMTAYATTHCQQPEGGICNEPMGKQQTVTIPDDNDFHTWSIEWDRTTNDWFTETITWRLDDNVFFTLAGADIKDESVWATLAHAPYYAILNVAVGGTWPGSTDALTESGDGNMLEVQYVAVYESNWLADRRSSTTTAVMTVTSTKPNATPSPSSLASTETFKQSSSRPSTTVPSTSALSTNSFQSTVSSSSPSTYAMSSTSELASTKLHTAEPTSTIQSLRVSPTTEPAAPASPQPEVTKETEVEHGNLSLSPSPSSSPSLSTEDSNLASVSTSSAPPHGTRLHMSAIMVMIAFCLVFAE
jgi:hypothetical protein